MISTSTVPALTDASFADAVAPGTGLVAVDFGAEWCPPCRMMEPIVESIASEYASKLRVYQLDTDATPATMVKLGVRGLPTMLVFRDGELIDRIVDRKSTRLNSSHPSISYAVFCLKKKKKIKKCE